MKSDIIIKRDIPYSYLKNKLKLIYNNYRVSDVVNVFTLVPMHKYAIKMNTPLFYGVDKLSIDDISINFGEETIELKNIPKFALSFIGLCHYVVPKYKEAVKAFNWINGEISYARSEFANIRGRALSKKEGNEFWSRAIQVGFSASSFRLMCVKAEIIIFILMSVIIKKIGTEAYEISDEASTLIAGFVYACNISGINNYLNKDIMTLNGKDFDVAVNSMARYVWELTTLYNMFANTTKESENEDMMPSRHIFSEVHKYEEIYDFGDYDNFKNTDYASIIRNININIGLTIGDQLSQTTISYDYLSNTPKTYTDIPISNNNIFYNPQYSNVKSYCTENFDSMMEVFLRTDPYDIETIMTLMNKITNYEKLFRLPNNALYHEDNDGINFQDFKSALAFIYSLNIPCLEIDLRNLYFSVRVNKQIYNIKYSESDTRVVDPKKDPITLDRQTKLYGVNAKTCFD